jgi:hypothetical protein
LEAFYSSVPAAVRITTLLCGLLAAFGCCRVAWWLIGRQPITGPSRTLRGTTLVAPALWSIVALAAVALAEGFAAGHLGTREPGLVQIVRYAAATVCCCPMVALLGARRPLERPWQAVVAALWLVLQLPALQWLIARPGAQFELPWTWTLFLVALILLPAANYLPTRHAAPSIMVVAAAWFLLGGYLRASPPLVGESGMFIPPYRQLLALLMGVSAVEWIIRSGRRQTLPVEPIDRVWLDFRNAFGAFWALRVIRSINEAPAATPKLNWHGFCAGDPPRLLSDMNRQGAVKRLRSSLWRFVPPAWIDARLYVESKPL